MMERETLDSTRRLMKGSELELFSNRLVSRWKDRNQRQAFAWYWPLVFLFFSLCLLESFICSAFPTLWVKMAADNAVSLEQIKSQSLYDLAHMPIEELFKQLKCTKGGLTLEEAASWLQIFGPNKLEEKEATDIASLVVKKKGLKMLACGKSKPLRIVLGNRFCKSKESMK